MYNLNVNVSSAGNPGLLAVEGSCSTTPKTPEILNSLMAMSNPFEGLTAGRAPALTPGSTSDTSCSGSPLASPTQPPSVQHTCSQLIKEGLKLTIQTKRRQTGQPLDLLAAGPPPKMARRDEVSHHGGHYDDDYDDLYSPGIGLTPEDEERRRRRRERNKIAATKCRLKKRERTHNLVQESEVLESQNHELKSQIQELEGQRRRLVDMLSVHTPTCMRNNGSGARQPYAGGYAAQSPTGYEAHCGYVLGYAASPLDHPCMA
ncbi:activating transcription factor 3-like isoform X1 [Bacillus rossius redtenbacheri]|uniref:activating transcription factor 3-like isoform X1 n=1 Tax=Bacillus rossius redtenbacheri TaxID=93214 RepID=UPI002FDD9F9E